MSKIETKKKFYDKHTYKCENGIYRVITDPKNLFEWFWKELKNKKD